MTKPAFKKISVFVVAMFIAAIFETPAQAVSDISVSRTDFGAGVASNVGVALTGFDPNQSYQATVKFVDTATNLDVANGVLAATQGGTSLVEGYSSYSAAKLGFKGTYAEVAAALSTVTWNPGTASGSLSIRIGVAPYAGEAKFYDANSGHYYQYVSEGATWANARNTAEDTVLYGMKGYLAEINSDAENRFIGTETSATNIWIGATEDATTTADFMGSSYDGASGRRWIWAGALETPLPVGSGAIAQSTVPPAFSSWANNEPNNDSKPGADCAVTNWSGAKGNWNDLTCTRSQGYLIEFGGRTGESSTAASATITQTVVAKGAVTLGAPGQDVSCIFGRDCDFPLSVTNPTALNSANEAVSGVFSYSSSNASTTTVSAVEGGARVALVGAGSSTITATFTPTETAVYAGGSKSFRIIITATAPSAPTGLIATAGNTSVALSWGAGSTGGSEIQDYLIEYSTDNSNWTTFADGTNSRTLATVTGLANGILHYFRVSAVNIVNTSAASSATSATPVAPAVPNPSTPIFAPSTPVAAEQQPTQLTVSGTSERPAPLVARSPDELPESLKPVIVDIFETPPRDAPVLSAQRALDLVTSTTDKVVGNSPSLVLVDGQYQPSTVVILDNTIAQVVTPNGGVMNVQAKNGEDPIVVNEAGRIQMLQNDMVVAQGNGLAPDTEFAVYLFSNPTLLGVGRTNATGEFFVSFPIEDKIPAGDHTLQVNGLLADGRTSSVSMPVSVTDNIEPGNSNAVPLEPKSPTDSPDVLMAFFVALFLLVIVAGSWIAIVARRRKKGED
jgi:hypothetical protein